MRLQFAVAACLAALILAGMMGHSQAATRYDHGRWWDGTEFVEGSRFVVDGRFVDAVPDGDFEIVDLQGQYVIPPYAEAHNHNLQNPWLAGRFSEAYVDAGILYALMMCGNGQTRAATLDALAETPLQVELASACVTSSDGHPLRMALQPPHEGAEPPKPEDILDQTLIAMDSPDEVEGKWPLVKATEANLVKIVMVHGEDESRRGKDRYFGVNGLRYDVVRKLVPYLQSRGLRVAAHVESATDFAVAVEAGVDIIAHIPGYHWWDGHGADSYRLGSSAVARAAEQETYVITTASVVDLFVDADDEQRDKVRALQKENLAHLRKAGVPVIIGSDRFDADVLTEHEYLQGLDVFTPKELFNMLTRDTARAIFPGRSVGRLAVGHEASFLVLTENPLENPAALRDLEKRVVKGRTL
ncbi:amidohydrolase family protein [Wenzhouxiangella sp. AB-CW3]|uniref:amidohydrolase family protein n=1 Tax=Wenzhouxiangella sp. AB-CW3 TaxID=2771012 RepID=UPI00168A73B1|nr:amidohydrolase family protein [Wenzhouxiangella sp. AB-CW3]QOC21821.1 amidohydrolase family protein [Wenzhouxiangella sp. AB-CW3]